MIIGVSNKIENKKFSNLAWSAVLMVRVQCFLCMTSLNRIDDICLTIDVYKSSLNRIDDIYMTIVVQRSR